MISWEKLYYRKVGGGSTFCKVYGQRKSPIFEKGGGVGGGEHGVQNWRTIPERKENYTTCMICIENWKKKGSIDEHTRDG